MFAEYRDRNRIANLCLANQGRIDFVLSSNVKILCLQQFQRATVAPGNNVRKWKAPLEGAPLVPGACFGCGFDRPSHSNAQCDNIDCHTHYWSGKENTIRNQEKEDVFDALSTKTLEYVRSGIRGSNGLFQINPGHRHYHRVALIKEATEHAWISDRKDERMVTNMEYALDDGTLSRMQPCIVRAVPHGQPAGALERFDCIIMVPYEAWHNGGHTYYAGFRPYIQRQNATDRLFVFEEGEIQALLWKTAEPNMRAGVPPRAGEHERCMVCNSFASGATCCVNPYCCMALPPPRDRDQTKYRSHPAMRTIFPNGVFPRIGRAEDPMLPWQYPRMPADIPGNWNDRLPAVPGRDPWV